MREAKGACFTCRLKARGKEKAARHWAQRESPHGRNQRNESCEVTTEGVVPTLCRVRNGKETATEGTESKL